MTFDFHNLEEKNPFLSHEIGFTPYDEKKKYQGNVHFTIKYFQT